MANRRPLGSPSTPGANATVVVFDDNNNQSDDLNREHVNMTLFSDQSVTIDRWWAATKTSPLRKRATETYTATAVHASLPVTAVAKASLVNNDYFTVTHTATIDGVATATVVIFEYKIDGAFVATTGRVTVDVSAASTATTVAVATAAAITTAFAGFASCPVPSTAVLTVSSTQSGSRFVISATENVANAGFTIGAATVGVEGVAVLYQIRQWPGRNKMTITMTTAPTEFDCALDTDDDLAQGGTTA